MGERGRPLLPSPWPAVVLTCERQKAVEVTMKKILIGLLVIVIFVSGGAIYVTSQAGSLVRDAVVTYGPAAIGAPITVGEVTVSVIDGRAGLRNLVIGNPEGFKSDHALSLGEVRVALDIMSLFSNRIVIDEVTVVAPEITYELARGGSNIAVLQRNAEQTAAALGATDEPASDIRLLIRELNITDGKVTLAAAMLGGKGLTVALPDIHKENIGAGDDGATPADAVKEIMALVSVAVTEAVSSGKAQELLSGIAGNLGGSGGNVADTIKEKAGETIGKLKGLFKKRD